MVIGINGSFGALIVTQLSVSLKLYLRIKAMKNTIYNAFMSAAAILLLGASQTSMAVEQMSDDQLQSTALPVVIVMSVNSSQPASCEALAPSGLISQSLSQAQTLGLLACQQNEENLDNEMIESANADQFTDENSELIEAQADLGNKLDLSALSASFGAGAETSETLLANDFLGSLGLNITQNNNLAFNNRLTRGSLGFAIDLDDALIDSEVLNFFNDQYGLANGTTNLLENIVLSNLNNLEFSPLVNPGSGTFTVRSNLFIERSYSTIHHDLDLETINLRAGEVTAVVTVNRN